MGSEMCISERCRVDGCKAGWFTIALDDDGGWDPKVFNIISDFWDQYTGASLILIDIHMDLSSEPRQCDLEARKILQNLTLIHI